MYAKDVAARAQDTMHLISREGVTLALTRPGAYGRTSEGGQRRSGASVDLLPRRWWFGVTTSGNREIRTPSGEQMVVDGILVGRPGADVREGDTFAIGGLTYVVRWVSDERRFETRAFCQAVT